MSKPPGAAAFSSFWAVAFFILNPSLFQLLSLIFPKNELESKLMITDELLEALKINKDETLARFSGNEDLFVRFLNKFPNDETLPALKESVKTKDWAKIETDAHTLKGLSGNLGFSELYKLSAELVVAIRAKDFDKAKSLEPQVIECGDKIVEYIKSNQL